MSVDDNYVRGIAEAASQRRRQAAIATAAAIHDTKRNGNSHDNDSNGNGNGVMHQLDYECFDALVAIEKAYEVLDRTLQLRVEKWAIKLSMCSGTVAMRRNRNNYALLLLEMVRRRRLDAPFERMPDASPLPRLPMYLASVARPVGRKKCWHIIASNLGIWNTHPSPSSMPVSSPPSTATTAPRSNGSKGNNGGNASQPYPPPLRPLRKTLGSIAADHQTNHGLSSAIATINDSDHHDELYDDDDTETSANQSNHHDNHDNSNGNEGGMELSSAVQRIKSLRRQLHAARNRITELEQQLHHHQPNRVPLHQLEHVAEPIRPTATTTNQSASQSNGLHAHEKKPSIGVASSILSSHSPAISSSTDGGTAASMTRSGVTPMQHVGMSTTTERTIMNHLEAKLAAVTTQLQREQKLRHHTQTELTLSRARLTHAPITNGNGHTIAHIREAPRLRTGRGHRNVSTDGTIHDEWFDDHDTDTIYTGIHDPDDDHGDGIDSLDDQYLAANGTPGMSASARLASVISLSPSSSASMSSLAATAPTTSSRVNTTNTSRNAWHNVAETSSTTRSPSLSPTPAAPTLPSSSKDVVDPFAPASSWLPQLDYPTREYKHSPLSSSRPSSVSVSSYSSMRVHHGSVASSHTAAPVSSSPSLQSGVNRLSPSRMGGNGHRSTVAPAPPSSSSSVYGHGSYIPAAAPASPFANRPKPIHAAIPASSRVTITDGAIDGHDHDSDDDHLSAATRDSQSDGKRAANDRVLPSIIGAPITENHPTIALPSFSTAFSSASVRAPWTNGNDNDNNNDNGDARAHDHNGDTDNRSVSSSRSTSSQSHDSSLSTRSHPMAASHQSPPSSRPTHEHVPALAPPAPTSTMLPSSSTTMVPSSIVASMFRSSPPTAPSVLAHMVPSMAPMSGIDMNPVTDMYHDHDDHQRYNELLDAKRQNHQPDRLSEHDIWHDYTPFQSITTNGKNGHGIGDSMSMIQPADGYALVPRHGTSSSDTSGVPLAGFSTSLSSITPAANTTYAHDTQNHGHGGDIAAAAGIGGVASDAYGDEDHDAFMAYLDGFQRATVHDLQRATVNPTTGHSYA